MDTFIKATEEVSGRMVTRFKFHVELDAGLGRWRDKMSAREFGGEGAWVWQQERDIQDGSGLNTASDCLTSSSAAVWSPMDPWLPQSVNIKAIGTLKEIRGILQSQDIILV